MNLPCTLLGLWCSLSGPASAIDGDTLQVNGQRVRLWGIDAPEWDEPLGRAAQDHLASLIQGFSVYCVPITRDAHRRIVARCYAGNTDLARALVSSGHALDCRRFSGGQYRDLEPSTARHHITQKPYC